MHTQRWVVRVSIFLISAFVLTMTPPNNSRAQDSGRGFTITPPVFELNANAGDKISESLSLYNNGSESIVVATTIENLKPIGEKGQVSVVSDEDKGLPSLKDWIGINKSAFSLSKGETKNIKFDISVPQNAEPGGHFATILFGTTNSKPDPGTGSILSQKIGTLVFLTVAGKVKESARSIAFTPSRSVYWKNQNIDFMLKVQNSGNVYIRPRGYLIISDIFGRKISEVEIDGKNVLPSATREIPIEYLPKHFWGHYTATVAMVYGSTNQSINVSAGFWVIPLLPTLVFIAIIVLIFILRKRLKLALMILFGKKVKL